MATPDHVWVLIFAGTFEEGGPVTDVAVYSRVEDGLEAVWSMLSDDDLEYLESEEGWEPDDLRNVVRDARTATEVDRALSVVNSATREWDNPTEFSLLRTKVV